MKAIFSFALVFQFSILAQAAADSVAFFLNPEKAVVLVKEYGSQGRLQSFMDTFQADTQLVARNQDQSIRISCARSLRETSCTFGFAPGAFTHFGDKSLEAAQSLPDLNLPAAVDFEMSFESSREQRFDVKIEAGVLRLKARQRGA